MGDKISVIVPIYNAAEYLKQCVDSILAQSYENLEILLIDDGSTDESLKISRDYEKQDKRVRVVHQENAGVAAARNTGLREAAGEYIGFVDSDDWIQPDMYEKMLKACIKNQAQIAVTNYAQHGENGENPSMSGQEILMPHREVFHQYLAIHPVYRIYNAVWSKLFQRSVIENLQFPGGQESEDITFTTEAFLGADCCIYLDMPLYNYRICRSGSIMNSKIAERRFHDEIPLWKKQGELLSAAGEEAFAYLSQYGLYRQLLYYYLDFYHRKDIKSGKLLKKYISDDRTIIQKTYEKAGASKGDFFRMKLFLFSPGLFRIFSKINDNIIVPAKLLIRG